MTSLQKKKKYGGTFDTSVALVLDLKTAVIRNILKLLDSLATICEIKFKIYV